MVIGKTKGVFMSDKIAVLMMAYGGPDSLDDVEAYYIGIRHGHKPSPQQLKLLKDRYAAIGGSSPLLGITKKQAQLLEEQLNAGLNGRRFDVYIGMKHWRPFIGEALDVILGKDYEQLVTLPMAPYYSKMSVGAYDDIVKTALQQKNAIIDTVNIERYGANPLFIKALADMVSSKLKAQPKDDEITIVFTAHSLPAKILGMDDPYTKELTQTCELVAKFLGLKSWHLAYQSAGNTDDEWIGPTLLDTLARLKTENKKNFLLVPMGFISDNLEILYDIDIECREFAKRNAINVTRTDMLNYNHDFIYALAGIVKDAVARSGTD